VNDPSSLRARGPALYSIVDAARALAVSRSTVYELIAAGELQTVTIGSRRLVPAWEIGELVQRLCVHGE
jgi:excisionase family DNA binding protein